MKQGERLKEARKALGLTLEKFGSSLGLKKSALSLIENGRNDLTEANARAICREYHVNYKWLTTGEGEMFQDSDNDVIEAIEQIMAGENEFYKSLFRAFAKLDDSELIALEKLVDRISSEKELSPEEKIDREVAAYRADLELEERQESSASGTPDAKEA